MARETIWQCEERENGWQAKEKEPTPVGSEGGYGEDLPKHAHKEVTQEYEYDRHLLRFFL